MLDEVKGIVKHSLLYGIGNWVRPMLAFLMIPILTTRFDPGIYADYNLLVLSVEILGLIFGGRVEAAVTRYYFDRKDLKGSQRVVSTALILALGIGASLCVIGYFASPALTWLVFERTGEMSFTSSEYTTFFHLVFLTLFFQLTSQVGAAYIRIRKKALTYSLVAIAGLFIGLSLNIYFIVVVETGPIGIFWSSVLSNLFVFLVYTVYVFRSVPLRFDRSDVRDLFAYGIPLIPGSVAYFIITFGDRFFLNEFCSRTEHGIYTLAYKFGILVSYAVTKPFMEFWRVRAYELFARGRVRMKHRRAVNYYAFCVVFAALMLSILIDQIIRISGDQYWEAARLVPWIAMGYIFAGLRLVFEIGIHMKKKTKYSSYVTVASLGVNTVLNLALIPSHGAYGAALSTFFTFLFMACGSLILSERVFRIRYNLGRIVSLILVAGGLFGVSRVLALEGFVSGLIVNSLLGLSFPLVLYCLGYYRPEEKRMIAHAFSSVRELIKAIGVGARSRIGMS